MSTAAPVFPQAEELQRPLDERRPAGLRELVREHPRVVVGLALLAVLALVALLAPWISPADPLAVHPENARLPPGAGCPA